MTEAYAYWRVSGLGQVEKNGFVRQLAAIENYGLANQVRIVRVFRKKGVAGSIETMNRPEVKKMMTALHADSVRVIVIEKLDRLSRDLMVQEATLRDLNRYGFSLVSTCEPDLMANDGTRIFLRQLLGGVAQLEIWQIVTRLAGARQRIRAQKGRCVVNLIG